MSLNRMRHTVASPPRPTLLGETTSHNTNVVVTTTTTAVRSTAPTVLLSPPRNPTTTGRAPPPPPPSTRPSASISSPPGRPVTQSTVDVPSAALKERAVMLALKHCERNEVPLPRPVTPPQHRPVLIGTNLPVSPSASPILLRRMTPPQSRPPPPPPPPPVSRIPPPPTDMSTPRLRAEVNVLMESLQADIDSERRRIDVANDAYQQAITRTSERLEEKLESLRQAYRDLEHTAKVCSPEEDLKSFPAPVVEAWEPVQRELRSIVLSLDNRKKANERAAQHVQDKVRNALKTLTAAMETEKQTREANLGSYVSLVESVVVGRLVKQVQDLRADRVHRLQCLLLEKK
eukprot:PhF_6_TR31431/c0_g1_i3/m.46100